MMSLGIAVPRRAALDDVGNVDLVALEANRRDDSRQQLSRAADERNPLDVFVGAWSFADEHQVSLRIADAEHNLPPPQPVQLALGAIADVGPDGCERLRGIREERDVGPGIFVPG